MEDITIKWEQYWADKYRCDKTRDGPSLIHDGSILIKWDQYYMDKHDKECDSFDDLLGAVSLTLLGTQGAIL